MRTEREGVERETENANIEADKVAIIQNEVSRKQADAESDLAKAEPAVLAAMSALDTLDKSQLGQCKTMSVPPPGVVDIFIACMVRGVWDRPFEMVKTVSRHRLYAYVEHHPLPRGGRSDDLFVDDIQSIVRILVQITAGSAGDPQRQCCREQADWQGPRKGSHLGQRQEIATGQH